MNFKLLIYCLVFLFFYSCANDMGKTDRIGGKIISQFAKQMEKQGLYAAGTGGGASGGKINLVDVCFTIHQVMDLEKARGLIVESSQALLNLINENIENKDNFLKFPITIDLIQISIIGETPKYSKNYISSVSIIKGNIYYRRWDPTLIIHPLNDDVHSETFAEAQAILSGHPCD